MAKEFAYPKTLDPDDVGGRPQNGMSLMDHFASQALNGYLSSMPEGVSFNDDSVANICYNLAEAMMRRRKAT